LSSLHPTRSVNSRADATLDAEILTFALNLEYLEAEFYLLAATGEGLPVSDIGPSPGPVTGGRKVAFTNPLVAAYASEIAAEEHRHRLGDFAPDHRLSIELFYACVGRGTWDRL
jgi:hypothetical protein